MSFFLPNERLPQWFKYPDEFIKIVDLGIVNLKPWYIMEGDTLVQKTIGINQRFPKLELVPFAKRDDNDDVACWSKNNPSQVVVVHDFSEDGWENVETYGIFWDWFKTAVDAMIEFD
jgi:hypothetical protein